MIVYNLVYKAGVEMLGPRYAGSFDWWLYVEEMVGMGPSFQDRS